MYGVFHGTMVVSMRAMAFEEAKKAFQVTAPYSWVHGAPVHAVAMNAIGP